jgi:hypothetical protein
MYMAYFPLLPFALLCSPLLPFLLTWNPPCCDRIYPPRSQVARKLTSPFPHLAIYPPTQNPNPPGFSRSKYTLIRTTLRTRPISSLTVIAIKLVHCAMLDAICSVEAIFLGIFFLHDTSFAVLNCF